ncbi:hypothetical protein Tco_0260948 [Tanacetum coccineum]
MWSEDHVHMECNRRLWRNTISGSIPINRGLIQAISTSLSPQPIGEATKAFNLRRIPPAVQGRLHFTYFLYLIVQMRILLKIFTTSSKKETNHYTRPESGPIPGMTPAQALTTIQTMADHSQKWHDGTTSRNIRSSSSNDGLAALVGCQICKGPHLDKDCPLNEEVKQVKEVRYGEFGRTTPFIGNNRGKFHVGPLGYYTKTDNYPPYGERRQRLEELLAKHQEESARKSSKMEVPLSRLKTRPTRSALLILSNLRRFIANAVKSIGVLISSSKVRGGLSAFNISLNHVCSGPSSAACTVFHSG